MVQIKVTVAVPWQSREGGEAGLWMGEPGADRGAQDQVERCYKTSKRVPDGKVKETRIVLAVGRQEKRCRVLWDSLQSAGPTTC